MKGIASVVAMVVVGVVLFFLVFTAEGVPSAPQLTSNTTLNPSSGAQVFSWTASATVNGVQPINSIDEQGAWYTYSVYQNGHPVTVNQRLSMGVVSQSGSTFTLQAQPTVGLPSLCAASACGGSIENVSIQSWVIIPTWTGVQVGAATNVTFSTVSAYTTTHATNGTPLGAFLFASLGLTALLVAVEATIFLAAFGKSPHVIVVAAGGWILFLVLLVVSWTVP